MDEVLEKLAREDRKKLRGLAVDEQQRATVESCCDSDQLHRWLIRLETAERFADALDN